jgi:hypothetical protein
MAVGETDTPRQMIDFIHGAGWARPARSTTQPRSIG